MQELGARRRSSEIVLVLVVDRESVSCRRMVFRRFAIQQLIDQHPACNNFEDEDDDEYEYEDEDALARLLAPRS